MSIFWTAFYITAGFFAALVSLAVLTTIFAFALWAIAEVFDKIREANNE